jgi:organic radical activating enzyme
MYNRGLLQMPSISLLATLKCNLKCRLCCVYSPFYKNPYHPEKEFLFKCIDRYFEVVDHVSLFTISGGEPLIRSDLDEIVSYLYSYHDRFDRFEIITNGTIIPSDNLLKALGAYGKKSEILIDDYGPDLSKEAERAYKAFSSLKKARVRLRDYHSEAAHCGGWVDFGVSKNCIKKSDSEAKALFNKCAYPQKLGFCISYINGKLWSCTPLFRLVELGNLPALPEEVFDFFDNNIPDEKLRQQIKNLYNANCLSSCAYCNGLCDDSERFLPAEQLE